MSKINAYAAMEAGGKLEPFAFDAGELAPNQVEINITACGLCHSDLSMINNDWRGSQYPLVAGHEAIGTVSKLGAAVTHLEIGQTVGVGWNSESQIVVIQRR